MMVVALSYLKGVIGSVNRTREVGAIGNIAPSGALPLSNIYYRFTTVIHLFSSFTPYLVHIVFTTFLHLNYFVQKLYIIYCKIISNKLEESIRKFECNSKKNEIFCTLSVSLFLYIDVKNTSFYHQYLYTSSVHNDVPVACNSVFFFLYFYFFPILSSTPVFVRCISIFFFLFFYCNFFYDRVQVLN